MIALDSCSIRIPLDQVRILDAGLQAKIDAKESGGIYIVGKQSGEVIEDREVSFKDLTTIDHSNGIGTKIGIEQVAIGFIGKGGALKKHLVLGVHSKMLGSSYFDGLQKHNLKAIYNYLMALKLFEFSYKSFIEARAVDMDYKLDFYAGIDEFIGIIDYLKTLTKLKRVDNMHLVHKKHKGIVINAGIEWGNRKGTWRQFQHLKLYYKTNELIYNSSEFYHQYIEGKVDYKNKARVEVNIKNKVAFKELTGADDTSLQSIVNVDQEALKKPFQRAFRYYMRSTGATKVSKPKRKIMLKDLVISGLLQMQAQQQPYEVVESALMTLVDGEEAYTKSRLRKMLRTIYEMDLKDNPKVKALERINKVFALFGFYPDQMEAQN